MPITINSPYSGKPVKIRDQDIGRAVRDEEDRIFYVVPRENGEGYYSAPTRKGSAKDEARYNKMLTRSADVQEHIDVQHQAVHDATGRKRPGRARLVVRLVLVAGVLVAGFTAYLALTGTEAPAWWPLPVPGQSSGASDAVPY